MTPSLAAYRTQHRIQVDDSGPLPTCAIDRPRCPVADCELLVRWRGFCYRHDPGPAPRISFADSVFARIDASGDCWEWTGALDGRGYGQTYIPGLYQPRRAHRVVYELLVGPIPDGLVIDHLCRNPSCVNPDHVEPVTQGTNIRRALFRPMCKNGHRFDPAWPLAANGRRRCRTCRNAWERADKARRRAERRNAA